GRFCQKTMTNTTHRGTEACRRVLGPWALVPSVLGSWSLSLDTHWPQEHGRTKSEARRTTRYVDVKSPLVRSQRVSWIGPRDAAGRYQRGDDGDNHHDGERAGENHRVGRAHLVEPRRGRSPGGVRRSQAEHAAHQCEHARLPREQPEDIR